MNDKQFYEKYCLNCGTQRCEGIGTEWFDGCKYKWNHDSYDAATEIERLNAKIAKLEEDRIGICHKIDNRRKGKVCSQKITVDRVPPKSTYRDSNRSNWTGSKTFRMPDKESLQKLFEASRKLFDDEKTEK